MLDLTRITHGCEHELADWPATQLASPSFGLSRDIKDITVVNSNGIANDPSLKLYGFGGEICTAPTDDPAGQAKILSEISARWPEAQVNYRSNLHYHLRIPGLSEDLFALKRFAFYNAHWLPKVLPWVDPLPSMTPPVGYGIAGAKGWKRRVRRNRVSRHTVLPRDRLDKQLAAGTVAQFHDAEVPVTQAGKPMPHAQPRAAVNLRQLLQTDTVEFRHFHGTLSCTKLFSVGQWCLNYAKCALGDWGVPEDLNPMEQFLREGNIKLFPEYILYRHDLEVRYRATCHDASLPKNVIAFNIASIKGGYFDDRTWEARFKW